MNAKAFVLSLFALVLLATPPLTAEWCGTACSCTSSCLDGCSTRIVGTCNPDFCEEPPIDTTCGAWGECTTSSLCEPDPVNNGGSCSALACTTTIDGNSNNNTLIGTSARECIYGKGGSDTIDGKAGDDRLFGGNGTDTIYGDSGNDCLYGEGGNDHLDGGSGTDYAKGGDGTDTCPTTNESRVECESL